MAPHRGLLILLLPSLLWAQPPTPEIAPAAFAEVRPLLEDALGYHFQGPPLFRPVSAADFRRISDPELEAQVNAQFPHLRGAELTQALEAAKEALRTITVAHHRAGTDTLLLPAQTPWFAQWVESHTPPGGQPGDFRKEFARLSLVHEAARLALDQRYQLAQRFGECRDRNDFAVLQALIEGRALWLTYRVAQRRGSEDCVPLLTERYRQIDNQGSGGLLLFMLRTWQPSAWTLSGMNEELFRQRHWAAFHGLAFFDYLEKHGVADLEQLVFTDPPRRAEWIEDPQLYWRFVRGHIQGLAGALARLQERLPATEWQARAQPWTPEMVRQVAELLKAQDRAEKVLQGWQDGASVVWTQRQGSGAQVAVGAVRFADAASARAYFGLTIDLQRQQDELLNLSPASPQRVAKSQSRQLQLEGVDEAVECVKTFQTEEAKEAPLQVTTLLIRSGNLVILHTWRDLPANPAWALSFFRALVTDAQVRP